MTSKPDDIDVTALLHEAEANEVDVERSKESLKALNNKGVSEAHVRRANKTEQSFVDGLQRVCKFLSGCFLLLTRMPSSCSDMHSVFFIR